MGRTSKKNWDEKFKNQIWGEVLTGAKKAKDEEDLKKILKTAMTDDEIVSMEKRLAVKKLLKEGIGYREISRRVGATRVTVNFIRDNFSRPIWKKRVYSKDKFKAKKQSHYHGRFRKYRFVLKNRPRGFVV
ncbi:MAG: Trp family transcriptional regulator [Candidatus Wolfebacteria bacterium]|nr:Trp family transcriptional regulator [Candidatus Wolfebacteria bacterium]